MALPVPPQSAAAAAAYDADRTHDGYVGVLLAAGAGRRAGGPKALRTDADGTSWLLRSITVLRDGGCAEVVVVLGCGADRARAMITGSAFHDDPAITVVEAGDWQQGLGSSLRTGLLTAKRRSAGAVLVHLVDLPDVTAAVVARLIDESPSGPAALARAVYVGELGHPVLLGPDHLSSVVEGLAGDHGANGYLALHGAHGVECGDLASGQDRDT